MKIRFFIALRDMDEVASYITNATPKIYEKLLSADELISMEIFQKL